ncbi:MAG: MerR family DNA-binding transcriptional regulator [Rhizobiales bacterium]|nr:MerR family DNA-binding transcriptional regulator [Hyphomicrobiales bacterium]
MNNMRIGEVAKNVSIGVETIRFYEQKGLIK